ncbi:MAG: hypothetical protein BYD32DRAFT_437983 [Podila humilis]|nr:MAG: hypothetical protein BYD32DRAFT_437983 [Podila humilis]
MGPSIKQPPDPNPCLHQDIDILDWDSLLCYTNLGVVSQDQLYGDVCYVDLFNSLANSTSADLQVDLPLVLSSPSLSSNSAQVFDPLLPDEIRKLFYGLFPPNFTKSHRVMLATGARALASEYVLHGLSILILIDLCVTPYSHDLPGTIPGTETATIGWASFFGVAL